MSIDRTHVASVVRDTLSRMSVDDCADHEERRMFLAEGALPIGWGLWCVVLLSPDGEVLSTDPDTNETLRSDDLNELACALVWASVRYPEFRELIPERPSDAPDCVICGGTGIHRRGLPDWPDPSCSLCAGLGWVWRPGRPPN